ncbi:MAG: hypothetical protein GY752_05825 [bacterium]|nr:hypothetical protein [bacterium]MCP4800406.1 hypothetical protein [bacterium]
MRLSSIFLVAIILFSVVQLSAAETFENHVILESNDDGEGMLFFPRQVEEGPDGNFYVLDSGDSFIKVFSPVGQYLTKMVGEGEGPGEFQRTDGATFGFTENDKLFFSEFVGGHRWISILELNGNLIHVLSLQLDVMFGIQAARSLDDGSFLVQFAFNSTARKNGEYFLYELPWSLAVVDSTGVVVSEIVKTDFTCFISNSSNGGTINLPFTPTFKWAPFGTNEVIWSDGMSPNLKVLDFKGKLVREFETPLPYPEKVTQSDLQQWKRKIENRVKSRNPSWWNRFGRVIEKYKKPLYDKPILQSISTTPSGNLLVYGMDINSDGFVYWLLDRQGKEVARVNANASRVHFSENNLLFITYDEEGIPQIHALKHFNDEATALNQMGVLVGANIW